MGNETNTVLESTETDEVALRIIDQALQREFFHGYGGSLEWNNRKCYWFMEANSGIADTPHRRIYRFHGKLFAPRPGGAFLATLEFVQTFGGWGFKRISVKRNCEKEKIITAEQLPERLRFC